MAKGDYDAELLRLTDEQRDSITPEWVAMAARMARKLAWELDVDVADCHYEIWALILRWARTQPKQFRQDAPMSWFLLKRMSAREILERVRSNRPSGIHIPREFFEKKGVCGDPIAAKRAASATRLPLCSEETGESWYASPEGPDYSWVAEMLERLPEGPRTLVRLRMDGYSDREIRERLGVSRTTVDQWIDQAGRVVADALAIEARADPTHRRTVEIEEDVFIPVPLPASPCGPSLRRGGDAKTQRGNIFQKSCSKGGAGGGRRAI